MQKHRREKKCSENSKSCPCEIWGPGHLRFGNVVGWNGEYREEFPSYKKCDLQIN